MKHFDWLKTFGLSLSGGQREQDVFIIAPLKLSAELSQLIVPQFSTPRP